MQPRNVTHQQSLSLSYISLSLSKLIHRYSHFSQKLQQIFQFPLPNPKSKSNPRIRDAMVKLVSARDFRVYGPRSVRNRAEYINAGLYFFATILLLGGFVAQLSREPKSGLALILLATALITIVNFHDLFAHLAGIDYRLPLLVQYDAQLFFVEFAVPFLQAIGSLLLSLAALFLLIQEEKGHDYYKLEKHASNMLIAGPALWMLGSIHNSCQIYERADGHVQILQQSVHIPFLIGSLLFFVAAVLNSYEQVGLAHHGLKLLGKNGIWLSIFGSLSLLLGGLANVLKVFKMQQFEGLRFEKLRGGANERLLGEREGRIPLILEDQGRRKRHSDEERGTEARPTPYKDVLVGQSS